MTATQTRTRRMRAKTGGKAGKAEVQEFLDTFATALTAGDARTIAGLWEVPALVLSDGEVHAVGTLEEVEKFFGGAKEQYNQRGITGTRAEIQRLDWPTERIAVADVRWPWLDAGGQEKGEESSSYTFRRDDDGALKLRVIVMKGEKKD